MNKAIESIIDKKVQRVMGESCLKSCMKTLKNVMKVPYHPPKRRLSTTQRLIYEAKHKTKCPKFVYLHPGEGSTFTERRHRMAYLDHRKRVLETKGTVDNSPPSIYPHFQIKSNELWAEAFYLDRRQTDNNQLLHALDLINNGEPTIDNTTPKEYSKWRPPRGLPRQQWFIKLSRENIEFCKILMKVPSVYDVKKWEKEYDKHVIEMSLGARYPDFYKKKLSCYEAEEACDDPENARAVTNYLNEVPESRSGRQYPRCFLDVWADGKPLGRIVIRLRSDVVPLTAVNFIALCTGQLGMSYKGSQFHTVLPDSLLKAGDVINQNGTSGRSIYGPVFQDENFVLMHTKKGMVAMANNGPDTNNSQFYITMKPLRTLDGKNVVFGRVVKGFDTLFRINSYATSTGRPKRKITIVDCGLLESR